MLYVLLGTEPEPAILPVRNVFEAVNIEAQNLNLKVNVVLDSLCMYHDIVRLPNPLRYIIAFLVSDGPHAQTHTARLEALNSTTS